MRDPIRWGILATGAIATSFVEDLRLLPDAEVLAVGSRTPAAAAAFAERHGIPRAYGGWPELAADPDVDVVYIATPHSAHFAATSICLASGKATLTEKPLTLDLATSRHLVDLARSAGVFFMEAMWTRCFPAIRQTRQLVAEGVIGEVTSVQADFGMAGPFPPSSRLVNPALGGGALLDLGVYPVTLAQLILGAPDQVSAWAKLTPDGIDENTAITLGYASGALAQLSCSLIGQTPRRASITGTKGRIDLPEHFFMPQEYALVRPEAPAEVVRLPTRGSGYHYEAAEVHRCLRAGLTESPLVPLDETLAVMATLDAVRAAIGVRYPLSQTAA
ncbi:MAG: Gfo/Idh/MocA family oxidoreductase [Dactylosporangium sp.]|nr:Gfo/Idh/MocA family oxidoreductase [Dactylosporangium sp.]NNJ61832.1 Gfo/Idh/MocA family oxidoreductase [Dactylosporangium sp.]